jgi:hypothetical protein
MMSVRRAVVGALLTVVVMMSSDACDNVTDKDAYHHLTEAMRRASAIEQSTGRYPSTFEALNMAELRSFTSTTLVSEGKGLCIELWIEEGGVQHLSSATPTAVEAGSCET